MFSLSCEVYCALPQVAVTARPASTQTALVHQSLVGRRFAFPSIYLRLGRADTLLPLSDVGGLSERLGAAGCAGCELLRGDDEA